jgi:hypothetical protein
MNNNKALMYGGVALAAYFLLKPKNTVKTGITGINGYVENLHLISVKYIGASNSRGSRVKLESKRFRQSITASYDYKIGNVKDQAIQMLESKGFNVIGSGEFGDADIIVSNTFKPLK